jgi:hypothetical protein
VDPLTAKYGRLVNYFDHCREQGVEEIELSFGQLEEILGAPLPSAARNFRPWWSNSSQSPKPWQVAGFRSRAVHLGRQTVSFHRLPSPTESPPISERVPAARAPRMLVFASGTGRLAVHHPRELRKDDFLDPERRRLREEELREYLRPAAELYCCDQFNYTRSGIETLRRAFGPESVEVRIVSPGYGVIEEQEVIAPHSVSLTDFNRAELHDWADRLQVPEAVRATMGGFDLVVFLVGQCCLEAMRPPLVPARGQRLLLLATEHYRRRYQTPGVTVLPTGRLAQASCEVGALALKGYLFARLAQVAAQEGASLLWQIIGDDSGDVFWQAVQRALAAG